jgi:putative zinc finger protein
MVNREAVKCEQVWREISNYLEGEVDPTLRAAMDDHFRTCQRCRSVLEGTRNVIRLYGDERMLELPAGFGRRLEKKLAQGTQVSRSRWSTWSAWLVPAAAMALIAGGLQLTSSLTSTYPLKTEHARQAHGIPPDMLVVVSADAKVFHAAGCEFIHNKDKTRTLTAKEAIRQGYVPCLRCMRKYLNTAEAGPPASGLETDAEEDAEGDLPGSGR